MNYNLNKQITSNKKLEVDKNYKWRNNTSSEKLQVGSFLLNLCQVSSSLSMSSSQSLSSFPIDGSRKVVGSSSTTDHRIDGSRKVGGSSSTDHRTSSDRFYPTHSFGKANPRNTFEGKIELPTLQQQQEQQQILQQHCPKNGITCAFDKETPLISV